MKKTRKTRKKNNKIKITRDQILEFENWKAGDQPWYPMMFEATPNQGTILEFYPKDSSGPCACVYDITSGGYRTVPVKFLFEDKKEAKASRADFLEFFDNIGKGSRGEKI